MSLGQPYYCPDCSAPIKPKINFFGEGLTNEYMDILINTRDATSAYDLLLVLGTSLD